MFSALFRRERRKGHENFLEKMLRPQLKERESYKFIMHAGEENLDSCAQCQKVVLIYSPKEKSEYHPDIEPLLRTEIYELPLNRDRKRRINSLQVIYDVKISKQFGIYLEGRDVDEEEFIRGYIKHVSVLRKQESTTEDEAVEIVLRIRAEAPTDLIELQLGDFAEWSNWRGVRKWLDRELYRSIDKEIYNCLQSIKNRHVYYSRKF